MDHSLGQRDDKKHIEAEAAEWVIRLGGAPLSPEDYRLFESWCAESASHKEAFEFAQRTWGDLSMLGQSSNSLVTDITPDHVLKHPNQLILAAGAMTKGRSGMGRYYMLAAIFLVTVLGFGSFWFGNPAVLMASDYYTKPGEQRIVNLPDGSIVELSTESAIALHFNERERRVKLIEGAAYFIAAPMGDTEKRAFVVESANGTATALGTQFAVEHLSDAVEVMVAEHDVEVALLDTKGEMKQVVLSPGQSVRYSSDAELGQVNTKDINQVTAWRRGRLVFDQVPFAKVVSELNRYRRGRIVITDTTLADRRVSGVFQINDLDNALHTIANELGLRVASVPPLITVLY